MRLHAGIHRAHRPGPPAPATNTPKAAPSEFAPYSHAPVSVDGLMRALNKGSHAPKARVTGKVAPASTKACQNMALAKLANRACSTQAEIVGNHHKLSRANRLAVRGSAVNHLAAMVRLTNKLPAPIPATNTARITASTYSVRSNTMTNKRVQPISSINAAAPTPA